MEMKKVRLVAETGLKSLDSKLTQKLGSNQISPKGFLDKFTEATKSMEPGIALNLTIHVKEKPNFDLHIHGPVVTSRIKQLLKKDKGSTKPVLEIIGSLTDEQIEKIANEKMRFTNACTLEGMKKTIIGTAKSMGVSCPN